jgi:dimeric dUTPase (all-alpha-NTP-PPase superfamily)
MDTLMDAGQATNFVEECESLATDYHVCVLKPEKINQYTLYSCPINIGDDVNLGGDELRRSYIARLDAFYDYEITSTLTVSGVSCG